MAKKTIPTIVLGGSGYVAAEVLRLLLDHPHYRIETVVSNSSEGTRIDEVFPHLTGPASDLKFEGLDAALPLVEGKRQLAIFSAMPHGETAPVLARLLKPDTAAKVVDMSADFRFADPAHYQAVYGKPHPAPELLERFTCSLPDLTSSTPDGFISHPGCFTTGIVLALKPLCDSGLLERNVQVSAITGSTGAGRQPGAGTHHPHRQSSMWAYQPLVHRHQPEIEFLVGGTPETLNMSFVPHSGPFSRGIHSTIFAQLKADADLGAVLDLYQKQYTSSPFVTVGERMPTLKEVVGSNRCHIGVALKGRNLIVTSVIDNLVKGAAGGAVQWMNRLFELDPTEGLSSAVHGWI